MKKSAAVLTAAMLLLAACGPARNPAYVCTTNCAHYCPDGISGDQCRRDLQLQRENNEERYDEGYYDYPSNRLRAGYTYGDSYYYGNTYPTYYDNGYRTEKTVTYPNGEQETITTRTYAPY